MAPQTFGQPPTGDAGQSQQTNENPGQPAGGNEQQTEHLTRAQLDKILEERLAGIDSKIQETTSKAFQGLQSSNQKLSNKIDQAVELFQAVKGAQPTAAEMQAIREESYRQLQKEETSGNPKTAPGQGQEPQPQNKPAVNNLTAVANAMIGDAGFTIDQNQDPTEYAMIDQQTTDANAFMASVKKAIDAKQARLGRPRSTAANIPGAVGSGGPGQSLQHEYAKRKETIKRGDHKALLALKLEYRSRGLDVEAADQRQG